MPGAPLAFDHDSVGAHGSRSTVKCYTPPMGLDRGSNIVAFDFDERDPGMLQMLSMAVTGAKRNHRHVGICGEAPANYPEIAKFLTGLGIFSISVNPSSVLRTMEIVRQAEQVMTKAMAVASQSQC